MNKKKKDYGYIGALVGGGAVLAGLILAFFLGVLPNKELAIVWVVWIFFVVVAGAIALDQLIRWNKRRRLKKGAAKNLEAGARKLY